MKSVDAIQKGKFTLGGDASVAAGPVGRHVEAGTDIKLESEIYSYSRSRGLFAGIALEGAALQIDHNSTWALYSLSAYDILNRTEFSKLPAEVQEFYKVMVAYIRNSR
jgi:lipid-binding SYLF domain-containing protein